MANNATAVLCRAIKLPTSTVWCIQASARRVPRRARCPSLSLLRYIVSCLFVCFSLRAIGLDETPAIVDVFGFNVFLRDSSILPVVYYCCCDILLLSGNLLLNWKTKETKKGRSFKYHIRVRKCLIDITEILRDLNKCIQLERIARLCTFRQRQSGVRSCRRVNS